MTNSILWIQTLTTFPCNIFFLYSSLPTSGRKNFIPLRDPTSKQRQDLNQGFCKEYRLIVEQLGDEKSISDLSNIDRCTKQSVLPSSPCIDKTSFNIIRNKPVVVVRQKVTEDSVKPGSTLLSLKSPILVNSRKEYQSAMKLNNSATYLPTETPALVCLTNTDHPPFTTSGNVVVPHLVHSTELMQANNCVSQGEVFSRPTVQNIPFLIKEGAQTFVSNATALQAWERKFRPMAKVQCKSGGPGKPKVVKIVKSSMAVPGPSMSSKSLKKGRAFIMSGDRSVAVEVAVIKPDDEIKTQEGGHHGNNQKEVLSSRSQHLKPPVFKRKDSCVAEPFLILKNGTLVKLEEVEKNVPLEQIPVPPVIVLHSTTKGKPVPFLKATEDLTILKSCNYTDPPIELNSGLLLRTLPRDSVSKLPSSLTSPSKTNTKRRYFVLQSHSYRPLKIRSGLTVRAQKRKSTVYVCPEAREEVEEVQSDPPQFKCKICWTTCSVRRRCEYHVMNMHLNEQCAFVCDICGKKFATSSLLSNHRRVKHKSTGYRCEVCGSIFQSSKVLQAHEIRHTTLDPPVKCKICSKGFFAKNNLKRHEKDVHSDKKLICDVCGETFPTLGRLNEHKLTHLGSFSCNLCGKVCSTRNNLRIHKIGHKTMNYMHCSCGKKFASFAFYHNHKRICKLKFKRFQRVKNDSDRVGTAEQMETLEEVDSAEQMGTLVEVESTEQIDTVEGEELAEETGEGGELAEETVEGVESAEEVETGEEIETGDEDFVFD